MITKIREITGNLWKFPEINFTALLCGFVFMEKV
uniref:Uncharacterized protein n=1 Tax=Phage sp. ct17O1 TaxID=2825789 RepID=A0A8S5PKS0_9VIRU|nr:MAG TPA: hypothetical protein [Phage sp. ct17O1]DAM47395.1 MAG TPA: hypothetical protein [Caudoviricetes sp.]DAP94061.1 MAG TPA: hypothetical protein [Caudoviricetes sp.]